MSVDEGLVEWVAECLEPLGRVTMRKMMGGAVLYCEGIVFALVDEGDLYFKSDSVNEGAFEAENLGKFEFTGKDGTIATMKTAVATFSPYILLAPKKRASGPSSTRSFMTGDGWAVLG